MPISSESLPKPAIPNTKKMPHVISDSCLCCLEVMLGDELVVFLAAAKSRLGIWVGGVTKHKNRECLRPDEKTQNPKP